MPSRPIDPVQPGVWSGSTALPSSALATPAPSTSAIWITSSAARMQPAPTSIATRWPALRISAARFRSASRGTMRGSHQPALEWMVLCSCGGSAALASWMSLGTITQVTQRSLKAMRKARSIACLIEAGLLTVVT